MRRVVITGLGAVTPLGNSVKTLWHNLLAGASGIGSITRFDTRDFAVRVAGEVKNFVLDAAVEARSARRMALSVRYALNAVLEAVRMARLDLSAECSERVGVAYASCAGGLDLLFEAHDTLRERGPRRVSPTLIANMLSDSASGYIAIHLGVRGPNMAITAACATGGQNISEGMELIRRGDAEVVIAGGSAAPLQPTILASFTTMHGLARDNAHPERACKPFDTRRDGFVLAEGAGALVLEELTHAQARGAPIIAEIIGHGNSNDAYDMFAADADGCGIARAMQQALQRAALSPTAVEYINAHGSGTPLNDLAETQAIKAVFGNHAPQLAISSTKSMLGHMMGAAGAVEALICALVVQQGCVPPTINLIQSDPSCDLDYVPEQARAVNISVALSNTIGLGGHNAALLIRKWVE